MVQISKTLQVCVQILVRVCNWQENAKRGAPRARLDGVHVSDGAGAGSASVAKEALKFQEMWDGFEGLRKGRWVA